jgi:hypothetical protein
MSAEMTALFALAPVTGLARQDNQDTAHAEAAGCSRLPTACAATPPGMGTTLVAMLFSGGRAALAHQRLPRVQAPQRPAPAPITEDRLISNLAWDVG